MSVSYYDMVYLVDISVFLWYTISMIIVMNGVIQMIKISWKNEDAQADLNKVLDELIKTNDRSTTIVITGVISDEFVEAMNVDFDAMEFNGWECDWWSSFEYKGAKFNVRGGAYYGTMSIS